MNLLYVGLAAAGSLRLWRLAPEARNALAVLLLFVVVRTAFLTTVETPEPRYVLACFPAVLALAAHGLVSARRPA